MKMRLFYASHDGQARKISSHIVATLAKSGILVTPEDLAKKPSILDAISGQEILVVVAAVRYGSHLKPADQFLAAYSRLQSKAPLIIISVNLTARSAEKKTPQGNAYLRKWLRRHKINPVYATAIAGRLDYPSYSWFDRTMIRFIMYLTGGPTDPKATVEFTSWHEVDAIAAKIAALNAA